MTKYEIYSNSLKAKEKSKCGDHTSYKLIKERYLILTIADGVGSRKCDWLASKTACEYFINQAELHEKENLDNEDLISFCEKTDHTIKNTTDDCKGMLAVFAGIVWDVTGNDVLRFNIGDIRTYLINLGEIKQISKDESKAVIMKNKSGKIITSGGSAVIATGVTNALGTGVAEIHILKQKFCPGNHWY